VRPTPDEIAQVEADPSLVDDFIDDYLQDPRFGDRIISTFGDIYRTRIDEFPISASDFNIANEQAFVNAMGEESLRRLAHVALNDLPYGTVVTADFSLADENLAQVLPIDYPAGATGWQVVQYTDGRPLAGMLSDSSFWLRYGSTFVNANRGRANAISRTLLCQDYLSQPIRFERINLVDGNAIRNAIKENAGCTACHATLDPLAANLWGFFVDSDLASELISYDAGKEFFWEFTNETAPAYYGIPTPTLRSLGQAIAQDPKLADCATQQVYEILLGRTPGFDDTNSISEHRETFVDNNTALRSLYRSIMRSPEYRTDGVDDPRFTTLKSVNVDLIASQLEDLTGFTGVNIDGTNLYRRSDNGGLRTLLGGADGIFVTSPSKEPTVTQALVMEQLAMSSAATVVNSDFDIADPAQRKLFKDIDFTATINTNQDALRLQMQALRLQVLGQRVEFNSPEIEDDLLLWSELFAVNGTDTQLAWSGVLAALLRDPAFMLY
jgi:hypothetical protein